MSSKSPETTIPADFTNMTQEDLPPIGSLSPECTPLKIKYDNCFNQWFTERFLKGDHDLSVCDEYFKSYSACVKAAMLHMNIDFKEVNREMIGDKTEEMKKKAQEAEKKKAQEGEKK